ncbi:MAG: aminotransferase class V-fold PLP-dependent enzyme [Halobacteria archaeon]|nr:aminotransferase class V-fold PLP-dependent enzyme [Halobacteria archaeon]
MKPEELRRDVPALEGTTYLNTGASGPCPRRVVETVDEVFEEHEYVSHAEDPYGYADEEYEGAREAVARLLDVSPDEVALTHNTTDGINVVSSFFDWCDGGKVVTTRLEHSSGELPWKRLSDLHGVDVETVGADDDGRLRVDEFKDAVGDADLVCLSSVSWSYGTSLPVSRVASVAHDEGARVLVDAAQSVGQTEVDPHEWGADFVAGTGHKWLLGPWGTGFLYVSEGVEEESRSHRIGYRGVEEPDASGYSYVDGARRFEVSTESPALYAGLREAIEIHEEVGTRTVERRVERLTERLKTGLESKQNVELVGPRGYESGLVPFETRGDADEVVETLSREGIVVRSLPDGTLRASVHVFNTSEDVDRLLSELPD